MLQILMQGTELFNQRPDKGIQFLQENGLLNSKLDPVEVVKFLRENSGLDKAMIGDYISKKKNVESKILETFVKSFDFANTDIDVALRQYLETFRLPGEAPLIFLVMEHFAEHWHVSVSLYSFVQFKLTKVHKLTFFINPINRHATKNHLPIPIRHSV